MTALRIASLGSLVALTLLAACNVPGGQQGRQLGDFDFLELGMSYDAVVAVVGEADRDVGSGVYIMAYELADGRELLLQFVSLESLDGAYVFDPETNEREPFLTPGG